MDYYKLGQRIREHRKKLRLSQAKLAEKINVSTNYIGQIERGDRKPSVETLVALCNSLGTNMDYIFMDNVSLDDNQLILEIAANLKELSQEEQLFFYNMVLNYIKMKKDL